MHFNSEYYVLLQIGWKTATQICEEFNQLHECQIHPTNAGQIAAKNGIRKITNLYAPEHHRFIKNELEKLLKRRSQYASQPPSL